MGRPANTKTALNNLELTLKLSELHSADRLPNKKKTHGPDADYLYVGSVLLLSPRAARCERVLAPEAPHGGEARHGRLHADYQEDAPHTAIAYLSALSLMEGFAKLYTSFPRDNQ